MRAGILMCCLAGCGRIGFDPLGGAGADDSGIDSPVAPGAVVAMTLNYVSSCVLRGDGSRVCWGANDLGELGNGTSGSPSPVPIAIDSGWRMLGGGGYRFCGLKLDGSAWCWGEATSGMTTSPMRTSSPGGNLIAVGADSTMVAMGTTLDEWHREINPLPANVLHRTLAANMIDAYDAHACAIVPGDGLYCWGGNDNGGIGDGTRNPVADPFRVLTGEWLDVGVGHPHTCAIRSDHTLWCWGGNEGTIGLGAAGPDVLTPTRVGTDTDWWQLGVGGHLTCALKLDRSLWCSDVVFQPVDVGTRWIALEAGESHACGLQEDGSLWCFGLNDVGQLGTGDFMSSALLPKRVTLP